MNRTVGILIAVLVCVVLGAPVGAKLRATATRVWDVQDTSQDGQLSIYNVDENGSLLGMPVGSGDINGDGYDDVILAPFYGPSGPTKSRLAGGALNVYFGGPDMLTGKVIDGANPPPGSFQVWGARGGDFLGTEVDVGDVTGDGIGDILAGAQNADGFDGSTSRSQAGALYIIAGRETWSGPINLSSPPPGVVQILGAAAGDRLGFWMASGDVNDDGVEDVLVSADLAAGPSGAGRARGVLYIIPGRASFPARIDLGNSSQVRDLGITTVYGVDDGDHLGSSIVSGDFDGDGVADVAVSAGVSRAGAGFTGYNQANTQLGMGGGDGPNDDRTDAGEVYILYGRASWPATIALANPPGDVGIYYGEDPNDVFGEDLRAGDVDGDGRDELGVGALIADAPGRQNSGIGYVLWSQSLSRGERVDLRAIGNSARVSRFYGQAANDIGADSFALEDVDADGFADVLFGSPLFSPSGRNGAGDLKVVFGSADRLPPVVDFADLPAGVQAFQIVAADPVDMFVYSFAAGDVDGDGFVDLIPNAMGGDGLLNRHETAGDCYVISGRVFSGRAGRGPLSAPCLTRVEVTPRKNKYYAGESGIELTLTCSSTDPADQFRPGAVAVLRGIDVPTTFVSPSELHVRLDDAPDVRNQAGSLVVQVRNPESGLSVAVAAANLVGPTIAKAKAKGTAAAGFTINLTGNNYLPGATATVTGPGGEAVPTASVERLSKKKMQVRIGGGVVASGTALDVRVVNPGPAPSDPRTVAAP
jgi:hypothetical protein